MSLSHSRLASSMAKPSPLVILLALAVTSLTVGVGYLALGLLPAFLFTFGFLGGLIAWLLIPSRPPFNAFRWPFYAALALFVVHKLEERYLDFFPALAELTGVAVPELGSWVTVVLLGSAALWLLVPWLVSLRSEFGYYLAWTFFVSMGTTELAHFAFPLLGDEPYGYFPGMASVLLLAPVAWCGIARLSQTRK